MHYYKRNLGDYAKKAGRLSMLQHGSYTLLIDACYDREQFPTLEEAIEWTWASTTDETEAVTFVLRKFFTLEDGVYVQKRIQEEIAEYHAKAVTNQRIAIERETNRKQKSTDRIPAVNEPPPNHKPITNNHKPVTKEEDGFALFWSIWPKNQRKQAMGKCLELWKKNKFEKQSAEIVAHVENLKACDDWMKNNGQYIPAPIVYLNGRRWEGATDMTIENGILAGAI